MIPIPPEIRMPYDQVTETLPKVMCMAKVKHDKAFRDANMDYSQLGILWFQDQFAFPIDRHILSEIIDIPFEKICGEFGYYI